MYNWNPSDHEWMDVNCLLVEKKGISLGCGPTQVKLWKLQHFLAKWKAIVHMGAMSMELIPKVEGMAHFQD